MRARAAGRETGAPKPVVAVGDRFCQEARNSPVWVVERVHNVDSHRFPLVSLRREQYPDLTKTVSMEALLRGRDFRPAG